MSGCSRVRGTLAFGFFFEFLFGGRFGACLFFLCVFCCFCMSDHLKSIVFLVFLVGVRCFFALLWSSSFLLGGWFSFISTFTGVCFGFAA